MAEKPPCEYFRTVCIQCETKDPKLGNITDIEILKENLRVNCIPENIFDMDFSHYEDFLLERRKMIAMKIKQFYDSL